MKCILLAVLMMCVPSAKAEVIFCCAPTNDLYVVVGGGHRVEVPLQAAEQAGQGDSILVLADAYPNAPLKLGEQFWKTVAKKDLRVYVEYPSDVPGLTLGDPRGTVWEREVVAGDVFGPTLGKGRILMAHGCRFLPTTPAAGMRSWIEVARVAGYDSAVYGLPKEHWPALVEAHDGKWLIATTKLSAFVTGRFAPTRDWAVVWERILRHVDPQKKWDVKWSPVVRPAYASDAPLPPGAEDEAVKSYARWVMGSGLLVPPSREAEVRRLLETNAETVNSAAPDAPAGDGRCGILEGYASGIDTDGAQRQRTPLRADCQAESAMALAVAGSAEQKRVAANLLDYTYFTSGMCKGDRGDPKSPAFGLIAWGDVSPAWKVANYGDDNARVLLATIAAADSIHSDRWDVPLLRGIYANLLTTGKFGFRGDRVDMPDLMSRGRQAYRDAETVNLAPHFESYLWACYLWAYSRTGEREFLDKSKEGIRRTMAAYPKGWRWGDNVERARFLLPLAWLVRVEDTPEHRDWLMTIASDLLKCQQPCGAIQERLAGTGAGHYHLPQSNEAYGTGETPLIQRNGDPASDQLYTAGFTLLALHEAVAVTGNQDLKFAEDRLAAYLCRIQTRSQRVPYLDGTWFRAFDYEKWDYWASSADAGWGAWSMEAGWAQAWTAATLAMRQRNTTLWDMHRETKLSETWSRVSSEFVK